MMKVSFDIHDSLFDILRFKRIIQIQCVTSVKDKHSK